MDAKTLSEVLNKHKKWINDDGGERADLRGADLREADLSGAYLSGADLRGADLSGETKGLEEKTLKRFFPIACPEYGEFVGWKKHSKA